MLLGALMALLAAAPPRPTLEPVLSYGRLPTYVGVASGWRSESPRADLYSPSLYPGHADFVARGLGHSVTFREFRRLVGDPRTRRYLPFFLYDLGRHPIRRGGVTYRWALRLEDYRYADPDDALGRELVRLGTLIRPPAPGPILFVLSRTAAVRPSVASLPAVRAAGRDAITLTALLDAVGARTVTVLTPGDAVGVLRRVGSGGVDAVGPDDIAIFDHLPQRLPPVAGVITLAPQTPLSHVNLRARNRGTPNLYARSLAALPGADALVGQLVHLSASERRIHIRPITPAAAKRFRQRHRRAPVSIPRPEPSAHRLIDLTAERPAVGQVGAKAANYALLRRWLPSSVRPGWALGFGPYLEVLRTSGADRLVDALLRERSALPPGALRDRLATVRRRIRQARLPAPALAAIRGLLRGPLRAAGRARLRSSTNCEDLADFNGAGLYRSKGVATAAPDAVIQHKVLAVFASLWRYGAFVERSYYGIDHRRAAMALLITPAFRGEAALGVAITVPPDILWVNALPGARSVANPGRGDVAESFRFRFGARPPGRIMERSSAGPVFLGRPDRAPLLDQLARDLRRIHGQMTRSNRYGVDLEWKLVDTRAGPRLFYKQVRLVVAPHP